jgi:hypothetical protein
MKPLNLALGLASALAIAAPALGKTPAQAAKPTRPPLSGPGSLSGVWVSAAFSEERSGPPTGLTNIPQSSEGEPAPLLPGPAKIEAERVKNAVAGHPFASTRARCLPAGMPSSMVPPAQLPFEIIEAPALNQVAVLFEEFTQFRIIRMNQKHSEDPDPKYFGESVGHWEKGELVVDTIGISEDTSVIGVTPHSDALHVVEHLKRTGPDTMVDRMTIEDPKTFTRPWTLTSRLKRVPGMKVEEFLCLNDRNPPDKNGNTGSQLSGPGR